MFRVQQVVFSPGGDRDSVWTRRLRTYPAAHKLALRTTTGALLLFPEWRATLTTYTCILHDQHGQCRSVLTIVDEHQPTPPEEC